MIYAGGPWWLRYLFQPWKVVTDAVERVAWEIEMWCDEVPSGFLGLAVGVVLGIGGTLLIMR